MVVHHSRLVRDGGWVGPGPTTSPGLLSDRSTEYLCYIQSHWKSWFSHQMEAHGIRLSMRRLWTLIDWNSWDKFYCGLIKLNNFINSNPLWSSIYHHNMEVRYPVYYLAPWNLSFWNCPWLLLYLADLPGSKYNVINTTLQCAHIYRRLEVILFS